MNINRLSAKFVRTCETPGFYHDGGGLYLQVTSLTAKSWVYRYAGRYKGLGNLHAVSLAQARTAALACRQQRQQGVDPIDAKRAQRAQQRLEAAKAITFKECAAAYVMAKASEWTNPTHKDQWVYTLALVEQSLGVLPVKMIDATAVIAALKPIWKATPTTASRLRGRIESVLDFAKVSGYRDGENPARWRGYLEHSFPKVKKSTAHHAAMPYANVPAFLAKLRESDGITARALELCILTALRTGEVTEAKWSLAPHVAFLPGPTTAPSSRVARLSAKVVSRPKRAPCDLCCGSFGRECPAWRTKQGVATLAGLRLIKEAITMSGMNWRRSAYQISMRSRGSIRPHRWARPAQG